MTGRTLGHYEIIEKLGEGGMGAVYKARDTRLNRVVAIKVLSTGRDGAEQQARFVREAQAASALNHPNIVVIHDVSLDAGAQYLVMEYVAGKTLDDFIAHKGLGLGDTLRYGIQIASALASAHEAGIIHRDIKPSNIMITNEGVAKVLDFGLAKLTDP